jgi:hypothetical protein
MARSLALRGRPLGPTSKTVTNGFESPRLHPDEATDRLKFESLSHEQKVSIKAKYERLLANLEGSEYKGCHIWRKSRIAARIFARTQKNVPLTIRDVVLSGLLGDDPDVTDRLISQALNTYLPRFNENLGIRR